MTIKPELLRNPDTGELVLKMTTLGAGLCWRLPMGALNLTPDELSLYIQQLVPQMEQELFKIKLDNQRKLRKKYGKKAKPRKKHKEDSKEHNLKAVERTASAADEPTGA